ncbi:MAG: acyltransferase family protein [Monoglobaceae bacterium]
MIEKDCLSKTNTECLKGILAVAVLIHHIYQYSGLLHETVVGGVFQIIGYLAVAVFFFLSGYGLSVSYTNNRELYLKHFLKRRVLPFYCVILFVSILYTAEFLIIEKTISYKLLLFSVTFGGTVINGGWYLQVQLLIYLAWFVIYRCCKKDNLKVLLVILFTVLYCTLMIILSFPTVWYESILAFPTGIIWHRIKNRMDDRYKNVKIWMIDLFLLMILFVGTLLGSYAVHIWICQLVLKMMSAVSFVLLTVFLLYRVPIECKVTRFLGEISLEVYVFQGLFFNLFHCDLMYVRNPYVYSLLVILGTILLSYLIKPIIDIIYTKFKS